MWTCLWESAKEISVTMLLFCDRQDLKQQCRLIRDTVECVILLPVIPAECWAWCRVPLLSLIIVGEQTSYLFYFSIFGPLRKKKHSDGKQLK